MVNLDQVKDLAGVMGKGILLEMAPGITEGLINDLFHEWKVDIAKISADVREDRDLWRSLPPEQWKHLRAACETLGSLDFLTADLVVNATSKDFAGIASLFLNWPEAWQWLEKQVSTLKERLYSD